MTKKKETTPTITEDFNKIKSLWEKNKLENELKKLDPENVEKSISIVPKELIRFMTYLLHQVKDVDSKVKVLIPEERIPTATLLDFARKHKGVEFSKALLDRLGHDEKISKELGFSFRKQKSEQDVKLDNSVTNIISQPILNLKSRRLFTSISFMQGEDILLGVNAEIDELLGIVSSILYGAAGTLKTFKENAKGVEPEIYIDTCGRYLKEIDTYTKFISETLNGLEKTSTKTKKKKKKVKTRAISKTSKNKKNKVKKKSPEK